MKVYLVSTIDDYDNIINSVFFNEQKAEEYADNQDQFAFVEELEVIE